MIKVASYCRVSTDHDDQTNSFEAQQRYFKEYIQRQPDWELYEVYADEGITGTSTKKRVQFNRMIHDAKLGKFKLIITKEVSRFSRNLLDTVSYARELRAMGVGVLFMTDGIDTREPDAELRLSIMGSIAQEESRKTSARVKWGQSRQMERGVVFGPSLLGYHVKDGKISIEPEGAEIVGQIFCKYGIEKKGIRKIAKELQDEGYRTSSGSSKWAPSHLLKILKNEKYMGDLVQKKTYTPDYLTHEKKYNHGEEKIIIIPNHHEAIVDRELWDIVQSEIKRRSRHSGQKTGRSTRYPLSGKIRCGQCGALFTARNRKRKSGTVLRKWSCLTVVNEGCCHTTAQGEPSGCDVGQMLRDDAALDMVRQALNLLQIDWSAILNNVASIAAEAILSCGTGAEEDVKRLTFELQKTVEKKSAVLDAYFSEEIGKEDMDMMNARYDTQISTLRSRLEKTKAKTTTRPDPTQLNQSIHSELKALMQGQGRTEPLYGAILEEITVFSNGHMSLKLSALPQIFWFEK